MADVCVGKGCTLRRRDMKQGHVKYISTPNLQWLRVMLEAEGGMTINSSNTDAYMCLKCFQRYRRNWECSEQASSQSEGQLQPSKKASPEVCIQENDNEDETLCQSNTSNTISFSKKVPLLSIESLFYGSNSHWRCSICLKYSESSLSPLPKTARLSLLFYHNLWCPMDSRVCAEHLLANDLFPNVSVNLSDRDQLQGHLADRAADIINDLLEASHTFSQSTSGPKLLFNSLNDDEIRSWTGWSIEEFKQIHDICVDKLQGSSSSTYDILLLFWAKLRTNISWPQLSSLCGLSKTCVSRYFHRALSALNKTIVPNHLGVNHLSRQEAISHNTVFTSTFYGDNVTLVLDGTYIYIQKSEDHLLQKSSYCGQKKRNYLKFMSIVLPDGYVVDTIGPFYGNENDASITKQIMNSVHEIKLWLTDDDILIVDRGFRDVLGLLKSNGYEAKMPSYLPKGETQLSVASANADRMCTKTRWVVESYHGRLKAWRMFKEQLTSNMFIKVMKELVRVLTASLNAVRGPIYKSTPERDLKDQKLAISMKTRQSVVSPLAAKVKSDPNLSKRAAKLWKRLDGIDLDFPAVELEYLETIACGSYQIKQASGYIADHLTDDGDYDLWAFNLSPGLIRGQIRSRHKSQTKYNVWIEFDANDNDDPVKDYYCQCPAGSRTVGMCAHTASILYYLGHIAHQESPIAFKKQTKKFKQAIMSNKK